jgi:hypothetical protein
MRNIGTFALVLLLLVQSCTSDVTEKAPPITVLATEDTSHAAARRITVYVKLLSECTKSEVKAAILSANEQFSDRYDIIWLELVPSSATELALPFSGWTPTICQTKWVSPELDPQWHTPLDGFSGNDSFHDVNIQWYHGVESFDDSSVVTHIEAPKRAEVEPAKRELFLKRAGALAPRLILLGRRVTVNFDKYRGEILTSAQLDDSMHVMKPLADSLYDEVGNLGERPPEYNNYKYLIFQLATCVDNMFVYYSAGDMYLQLGQSARDQNISSAVRLLPGAIEELMNEANRLGLTLSIDT